MSWSSFAADTLSCTQCLPHLVSPSHDASSGVSASEPSQERLAQRAQRTSFPGWGKESKLKYYGCLSSLVIGFRRLLACGFPSVLWLSVMFPASLVSSWSPLPQNIELGHATGIGVGLRTAVLLHTATHHVHQPLQGPTFEYAHPITNGPSRRAARAGQHQSCLPGVQPTTVDS